MATEDSKKRTARRHRVKAGNLTLPNVPIQYQEAAIVFLEFHGLFPPGKRDARAIAAAVGRLIDKYSRPFREIMTEEQLRSSPTGDSYTGLMQREAQPSTPDYLVRRSKYNPRPDPTVEPHQAEDGLLDSAIDDITIIKMVDPDGGAYGDGGAYDADNIETGESRRVLPVIIEADLDDLDNQ